MSVVLNFGVIDIPYVNDASKTVERVRKGKRRTGSRWRRSDLIGGDVSTTGDVAEILEAKYHIMAIYAQESMDTVIKPAVENALAGAIETMMMGGPKDVSYAGAASTIEASFKQFLSTGGMDKLGYPGVPTAAALRGVNHRMKHPYARRAARSSFVDTGLYSSSFKVWI
jgi:hypothetical protein